MFYITGQHFQHFVWGLKKEAKQSPAWVSSLDEANKWHFVLTCATQAAMEKGTGRSRQIRDLKAEGWFCDWMNQDFTLSSCWQKILCRGRVLVPQFPHCKLVNMLSTLITKVLLKKSQKKSEICDAKHPTCQTLCRCVAVNFSFPRSRVIHTPSPRKSHQKGILANLSIPHLMMIHEAKQALSLFA